jgi:putative sigma-54 modulation protein
MTVEFDIQGRDMEVDDRLYDYVSKKVSKLDRFINGITDGRVDLAYVKNARSAEDRQVAQITIRGKGFILRSEVRTDDIYSAFDSALDKIERRIRRYKGKRFRGRGDGTSVAEDALKAIAEMEADVEWEDEAEEVTFPTIARRKHFMLIPMDETEAILQMELLGHEDFFVFYNANTDNVNVLYRRRDGSFGLIETEIG